MNINDMIKRRNEYAYPAVALAGSIHELVEICFVTTTELDSYLQELLLSNDPEKQVLGYLSVLYWGFYSGKDNLIRAKRAMGKVKLAYNGLDRTVNGRNQRIRGVTDFGITFVAETIHQAKQQIGQNQYGKALRTLTQLPGLQLAFASKICAFLDPNQCGVIDSVIAEAYPQFNFKTNSAGIVVNRGSNLDCYQAYCLFLKKNAIEINQAENSQWKDRDGNLYEWRALDVERALY